MNRLQHIRSHHQITRMKTKHQRNEELVIHQHLLTHTCSHQHISTVALRDKTQKEKRKDKSCVSRFIRLDLTSNIIIYSIFMFLAAFNEHHFP